MAWIARRRPARQLVAAAVASTFVVLACSSGSPATGGAASSTAGASPAASATAQASASGAGQPTAASPSAIPTGTAMESTMPFTLTSTAFDQGGRIPRKYSCDGDDVSPALAWDGAPDDTASFALIVEDPDARGFVHWVVFNMTGSQSGGLPEAVSAGQDAPPQGRNGFGRIGWGGPCPPSGTHRYRFTLLALDTTLDIAGTPRADEVRGAADGHVLDQAVLEATYTRGG